RSPVLYLADGYIFLAYARNISQNFSWSINPPETTFATSSALWTAMCALCAALVPANTFVLTIQLAGLALFIGVMLLMDVILLRLQVHPTRRLIAVGSFAAFAFNGFFYTISAMETPLFMVIFLLICLLLCDPRRQASPAIVGVLAGLLFLTR